MILSLGNMDENIDTLFDVHHTSDNRKMYICNLRTKNTLSGEDSCQQYFSKFSRLINHMNENHKMDLDKTKFCLNCKIILLNKKESLLHYLNHFNIQQNISEDKFQLPSCGHCLERFSELDKYLTKIVKEYICDNYDQN